MSLLRGNENTIDGGPRWHWRNFPLPEPHLILLAIGLILHRIRPWKLLAGRHRRLLTGWSLIAAGTLLAGWATAAAGDADLRNPNRLITTGPYALSRHPMYTGWHCIYLGLALVLNTRWPMVLSPLLFALVQHTARTEERQLEKQFGDEYGAYRMQVRRYL